LGLKDKQARQNYNKTYYATNKEKLKQRNRERVLKIKQAIIKIKEENPCFDCGKFYPYYVMDFDHVKGKKKFEIAAATKRGYLIETILKEIKKCDLVCSNCHRIRTYGRAIR